LSIKARIDKKREKQYNVYSSSPTTRSLSVAPKDKKFWPGVAMAVGGVTLLTLAHFWRLPLVIMSAIIATLGNEEVGGVSSNKKPRPVQRALGILVGGGFLYWQTQSSGPDNWSLTFWSTAVGVIVGSWHILRYTPGTQALTTGSRGITRLLGMVWWNTCWAHLMILMEHDGGVSMVSIVLAVAILTDVCASFGGKHRKKVVENPATLATVSPNKTRAGAFWGVAGGTLGGLLLWWFFETLGTIPDDFTIVEISVIAPLVSLATVWGDLAESLFKRWLNVKDSGVRVKAHGGILDRFDGQAAAIAVGHTLIALLVTNTFPL